jgi:hypothetical protein
MRNWPLFPQFQIDFRLIRIHLLDIFDLMDTFTFLSDNSGG